MENCELIRKAVKYIDNVISNEITIEDVAKNAGFSVNYFNRIFRNHTGFNVMEYARFRRLSRAARILRSSPQRDILSIALDCGYESHEGFIRAFKEQYGKTPSEYRDNMKDKPLVWADNELNATAVSEFHYSLPEFFQKDANDVINYLLDKDAKRYGYTAVTIAYNGSKIASDNDLSGSDGFVAIDNFYERPWLKLVLEDVSKLRKYVEQLSHFAPEHIEFVFYKETSMEEVREALNEIPCKKIGMRAETMYFGEPFILPNDAKKYSFKFLELGDVEAVELFISENHDPVFKKSGGYGLRDFLKKPLEERPLMQPMGVFENDRLLAISYGGLQNAHGFLLNNCVHTVKLSDTPNDAIKYLYMMTTNSVIEKGYIPFEDAQFNEYAKSHGEFDAFELGFEKVNTVFFIDF